MCRREGAVSSTLRCRSDSSTTFRTAVGRERRAPVQWPLLFAEPHRAREILDPDRPADGKTFRQQSALVSEDAEWVLKHLSSCLDSSAPRALRNTYSAIAREICKRRPDLNHFVTWDVLNTLSDASVDDLIERSLLLSLGPLRATGDSMLNESLRRTPIVSDSIASGTCVGYARRGCSGPARIFETRLRRRTTC